MDDATMATVKALVLGLHRSGAINAEQYSAIVDELISAAADVRKSDDLGALQIEFIADALLQAVDDERARIS